MGLKQNITVMNEFTTKTKGGGTRGGSPGDYIKRYMLRDFAVEDVTPTLLHETDTIGTLYRNRKSAAESADTRNKMKKEMKKQQKLAGIAFENDCPSMSHDAVIAKSKMIQQAFEDGKTVLKTVMSFDTNYLKQMHIIDEDDEWTPVNGWRGKVDQMRLRLAIMNGMNRMCHGFDDMEWMGTIQVDAKHVHCHLVAVDMGEGRVRYDGQQRGMLSEKDIHSLRRFTNMGLDETKAYKQLTSNIGKSRRNVRCLVKSRLHEIMRDHGLPQFLLACLPEDKRKWRAASNDKDMRKANAITREFVEVTLAEDKNLWQATRRQIAAYAEQRRDDEDLDEEQTRLLIKNGEQRVIEEAMNGVYDMLKNVPDDARNTETAMLDIMSMNAHDMSSLATVDKLVEFGFRLRSYSSRLDYHKKQRRYANEQCKAWEEQLPASEPSRPLYEFYQTERDYHDMCMAKYQSFLRFRPPNKKFQKKLNDFVDLAQKCVDLESMINDPSCKRIKSQDSAEDYGWRVYGQHGGSLVAGARNVLENRLSQMKDKRDKLRDDIIFDMEEDGLTFDTKESKSTDKEGFNRKNVSTIIHTSSPWRFDDVKMMDMHHLSWDFPYDADVSLVNIEPFVEEAEIRNDALERAIDYLERSGQSDSISELPVSDINAMHRMARALSITPTIRSARAAAIQSHRVKTTSLDMSLTDDLRSAVYGAVTSQALDNS